MRDEALTRSIIGAFYEVYNQLGYGFVESIYAAALERELIARRHAVAREVSVRIRYKGDVVAWQRLDMVVEGRVVVELKAGSVLAPVALAQLLSYLKGSGIAVGLLLHFGPRPLVRRVIFDRRDPLA